MFHRVADSAHVCSNLRTCVPRSGRVRFRTTVDSLGKSGTHRWQTTTGVRANVDDEPNASAQISKGSRSSRRRAGTYHRHWAPPQTAELGIDVLGRPAEVFILPSRNRRILQIPEPEENGGLIGIQESLASEFQPISRDEVKRNIEDIKDNFGQDTAALTKADWQDVKEKLASGFTKKQLKGYIIRSGCPESERRTKDDHDLDRYRKADLATDILENVWKFRLIPEAEIVQIGENSSEKYTKQIQVTGASLELALLDEKQPLKDIAEKYQIQLDVFSQQGRIQLQGDQQAVFKAQRQLRKLLDSFIQESVVLDEELQHWLDDSHVQEDFLNMLMQKHTVKIDRRANELQVLARNAEQINLVRRDLYLSSEVNEQNAGSHVWQVHDLSDTIVTPVYPSSSRNWFFERLDWERHIAKYAERMGGTSNTPDSGELKSTSERIFKQLASAEERKLKYYSEHTRFRNSGPQMNKYVFDLGQILSAGSQITTADLEEASIANTQRSLFISEIPYLTQVLAKLLPAKQKMEETSHSFRPTLIRIRLQPLQRSDLLPSFELLLTGREGGQGLKQPLQIHKVSAVLCTSTFDLLLPTQPADIRISKISTCELFDRRQSLSDTRRLRLLKSFAGCVDKLQNSDEVAFDPILQLDLSGFIGGSNLRKDQSAGSPSSTPTDTGRDGDIIAAENSTASPASEETPSQKRLQAVDYIVEPPETLDTRLYQLSQGSSIFLEHVFADAGSKDIPRAQELLQVVHLPTSQASTPGNKPRQGQLTSRSFSEMLKASINLIFNLGERGTTKHKRI